MKKIPGWAWVLLVGVVLLLPRLGSFGLWDPYEIKFADAASAHRRLEERKNVGKVVLVP